MILQSTLSPPPPHSIIPSPFNSTLFYSSSSSSSSFISFPNIKPLSNYSNKIWMVSKVDNYGTMDYEKKPMLKWNGIYKMICRNEDVETNVASILNKCENQGKRLSKWELCRILKELRKFKRHNLALEVYEWMNNRIERFRISSSDTAIQLDLIAKVRGVIYAEDYFTRVPDTLKDNRIYGALLNAYAGAKIRDKTETLMEQMRNKGYAIHPLPYNVMMTLYTKLNELDKVEGLISEMKGKNIPLDLYTYNIWLSARGSQGSPEAMEQVLEEMELDPSIVPNWTTYSTMAAMYVKMGLLEKAEQCLKNLETRITGRDRKPYHYLISLYGSLGNREEAYRVWNIYKSAFENIPNWGYHAIISSLLRSDDIEGAEKLYEEWLLAKSSYDPRVGNLLMAVYVNQKPFVKVKGFFDYMIETGGTPNASSWEFLGDSHIKEGRVSEALACFKEALLAEDSKNWRPNPLVVNAFMEICEQENNLDVKEEFIGLLTHIGCLQDITYRSLLTGFSSYGVEVESTDDQEFHYKSDAENDLEMLVSVID